MFGTSSSAPSDLHSLCLVTGSVPSAQLGPSAVLSVNFHSFLCLLHWWHLHQDFRNPSQKSNMTLPQLSARYALSTCLCAVRAETRTVGINFCTVTEMSMNCSLVNLHGFLDGLDNWNLRNRNLESVEFRFDWSLG